MGVSFETCFRRHGDVLMGPHCYVLLRHRHKVPIRCCGEIPLRRLGDVVPGRCWVFHLRHTCNVTGTYRETSLQRCYDVLLPGGTCYFHLLTPFIHLYKLIFLTFCVFLYKNVYLKHYQSHKNHVSQWNQKLYLWKLL